MILVAFLIFAILVVVWMAAPNGSRAVAAPVVTGKLPMSEPASA